MSHKSIAKVRSTHQNNVLFLHIRLLFARTFVFLVFSLVFLCITEAHTCYESCEASAAGKSVNVTTNAALMLVQDKRLASASASGVPSESNDAVAAADFNFLHNPSNLM